MDLSDKGGPKLLTPHTDDSAALPDGDTLPPSHTLLVRPDPDPALETKALETKAWRPAAAGSAPSRWAALSRSRDTCTFALCLLPASRSWRAERHRKP